LIGTQAVCCDVGVDRHELLTSVLRVALFQVAHALSEHFRRDVFVIHEQVLLRRRTCVVNERVCVGRQACYARNHIAV
jgi:hypothetical protein